MDDNLSIVYPFFKNLAFLVVAGILFAVIARLLVKDPAERKGTVKGVWAAVIIIGVIWFWSVADLRLPAFDQVVGTVTGMPAKAATVASVPTGGLSAKKATPKPASTPTPPSATSVPQGKSSFSDVFTLDTSQVDGKFSDGTGYRLYTIQPGDTIFSISKRFGISQSELANRNGVDLKSPLIKAGETLKIPI